MSTEIEVDTSVLQKTLKEFMDKPIRTELTRRDHFALAAMAALIRSESWRESPGQGFDLAADAYGIADAMEKARG